MKNHEDHYRELFATDRSNAEIQDPFVNLIDVYASRDSFQYQQESEEEAAIPKILIHKDRGTKIGQYAVNTYEEFTKNWTEFTSGQLEGLDWTNLFVAGGAVLGCMKGMGEGFQSSDIDLFLVGIEDQQLANEKVRREQ